MVHRYIIVVSIFGRSIKGRNTFSFAMGAWKWIKETSDDSSQMVYHPTDVQFTTARYAVAFTVIEVFRSLKNDGKARV